MCVCVCVYVWNKVLYGTLMIHHAWNAMYPCSVLICSAHRLGVGTQAWQLERHFLRALDASTSDISRTPLKTPKNLHLKICVHRFLVVELILE